MHWTMVPWLMMLVLTKIVGKIRKLNKTKN
jgi:hypothetical protein